MLNYSETDNSEETQRRVSENNGSLVVLEKSPYGYYNNVTYESSMENLKANVASRIYTNNPEKLNRFFDDLIETCPEIFNISDKTYANLYNRVIDRYGDCPYDAASDEVEIFRLRFILAELFKLEPALFIRPLRKKC